MPILPNCKSEVNYGPKIWADYCTRSEHLARSRSLGSIRKRERVNNSGDITIAHGGHSDIKITQVYDRHSDDISFSELNRLRFTALETNG